jgi:hypothetical protein
MITFKTRNYRSTENDKAVRLGIRQATDRQRAYVPEIVNGMSVDVVAKGNKAIKSAFANWTTNTYQAPPGRNLDIQGHMNIRPDMILANNAREILNTQLDSNWWVPVDRSPDVTLADAVIAHEIGHGVHGWLHVNHLLHVSWDTRTTEPDQMEFWNGFADAAGIKRPEVRGPSARSLEWAQGAYGRAYADRPEVIRASQDYMDIDQWFSSHRAALKRNISTYGTKKNIREMLAELWCEYTLAPQPRPLAKYYGDWVMSHYNAAHQGAVA